MGGPNWGIGDPGRKIRNGETKREGMKRRRCDDDESRRLRMRLPPFIQ